MIEAFEENKKKLINLDFIKQFYPDEIFFAYLNLITTNLHKVTYIINEDSLKIKIKIDVKKDIY